MIIVTGIFLLVADTSNDETGVSSDPSLSTRGTNIGHSSSSMTSGRGQNYAMIFFFFLVTPIYFFIYEKIKLQNKKKLSNFTITTITTTTTENIITGMLVQIFQLLVPTQLFNLKT